ncbi:PREDICTED: 60S ribosomal protein L36-like [Amphimedon queenslandica]|uniref:60S ribosomal protein L36 n=1 Tax=Amphimedon queenslandica TaxID=400682 RepID=A0AAN0IH87_AMPQE|nr:PREDICTED: 60S ribosomal protein L36-like [Amphimedon queenslandica]|eukprot:XP_003388843.1 PREDICTED: 60S ribosomal protein L36-like [Amphimedon queenslandica]
MGIQHEMCVGLKKGKKVTPIAKKTRPSSMKGRLGKRVKFVREIVKEVCGLAPYEKRMVELLKVQKDKRALKFAKRRLGTHRRAKKKREEMQKYLQQLRKAQHAAGTAAASGTS